MVFPFVGWLVYRFMSWLIYELICLTIAWLIDFVTNFDILGKRVVSVAPFIAATGASCPVKFGGNIKIDCVISHRIWGNRLHWMRSFRAQSSASCLMVCSWYAKEVYFCIGFERMLSPMSPFSWDIRWQLPWKFGLVRFLPYLRRGKRLETGLKAERLKSC